MKLRDLEDRGDFSRDRNDLLGAGEFEETESRLELEVMLLATRTCCGYPRPMYEDTSSTQPGGRQATYMQDDAQRYRTSRPGGASRAYRKLGGVAIEMCEQCTDGRPRTAEQQDVTNGARNALQIFGGEFGQVERCDCANCA